VEASLWGVARRIKKYFLCFVWGGRRTYEGVGRNTPS